MIVVLATLLLSGEAAAQPAPVAPQATENVANPRWLRGPDANDFARVYPRLAWRKGIEGGAKLSCNTNAKGMLTNCEVIAETPPGEGFGEAALKLAPLFRITRAAEDGRAEDGVIRIPLIWRHPSKAAQR